jgi:hypothetical protein
MSYLFLSSDVADAASRQWQRITDLLIDDDAASIWVAGSAAPWSAVTRSLADHVVTERGPDGLDVAHGASSGNQNVSVDPRHMDTFFLVATNGLEQILNMKTSTSIVDKRGSFNAHPSQSPA